MELVLNANKSTTLCLNMIVKNESKIITRLFDSVASTIDCYCICDTGSTDNTVELITEYFSKKNIPGKVVTEPFKNFCHNRNFAMQACAGMSDFILLMDAPVNMEPNNIWKNDVTDIIKTIPFYKGFPLILIMIEEHIDIIYDLILKLND